jgi:hypothetical protein
MEEKTKSGSPLRIRAHTLLCLQGFQGLGYSPEFIAEMERVVTLLRNNPDTPVEVVVGADIFCEKCPHSYRGRCTVNDPEDTPVPFDAPDESTLMDRRVLAWLEIEPNSVQLWGEILYKIGRNIDSSAMDALCGSCRWRSFPHCARALDELHQKVVSGDLLFTYETEESETA